MGSTGTFREALKEDTLAGSDAFMTAGVAMVIIGVLAALAPLASGIVFDLLFGALMIGAGVVELVDAFRAATWQRGVLGALVGLVTLAAGVLTVARPVLGLVALTIVLIGYLIFVGAFRMVMAFQLPTGAGGKFWTFLSGVMSLALAALAIAQMPITSAWLIGTYVGVSLVFGGVARISLARGFRKAAEVVGAPAQTVSGAHA
jgi:aquaporin Z